MPRRVKQYHSGRATTGALIVASLLLAACGAGRDGARKGGDAPVPVQVGTVVQIDVPTTIEGIGNVVPVNSVAVKSRVEGQIERVAVHDGAEVRRGDLLFQLDPRPFQVALAAAQATLERDQAQLTKAQDQLRRFQDVFAKGYVSADQLSDVRANARSAAASVAADQAGVENARLNLEFSTLRSPLDGRVGRVMLQAGNIVKAVDAEPLITINQMDPVYVEFAVPERYLADLQKAAKQPKTTVELTASAADGASLVRTGPLTFLDNAVDSPTGTVRLRATVENKDRALWPGQYTRVKIHVPANAPVLAVPASSVNQGPEGAYVYVLAAGDVAEQRPVTVARTDAEHAVVTTGVKAGELIIVDGQSRVIPGAKVARLDAKPAAQAQP
jgi:membrane fusion protein, multidrug efflux system